jgi:phage tail-like protein
MPQPGRRVDPYGNYHFILEIEGITRGSFAEVTGGDSTVDVIEHREGGDLLTPRKLPGMTKHGNLVLRWGLTPDLELYEWHREVVRGEIRRRSGSVVALDSRRQEVARWNFVNAWPSKYDMPDFNAEGNDVAVENVELVHEGIERVR